MAINVTSFEQIAPILSQLATNYSNIFFDYFNMFYNDTPMEITIEYYDTDNNIQSITVPNRAMDREFILNGHGDPNGNVVAGKGAIYQDLDDGLLYIKQTDISESTGWNKLVTLPYDSEANSLEDFLIQGSGVPEGNVEAARGVLYINTLAGELYIKTTDSGTTGWTKISAQIDNLANKSLSDLTPAGEAHFANPSLSNLDDNGNQKFADKEDKGNKKDIIEGTGSSQNYPSTKAVYDFVVDIETQLANRNLDNLTNDGYDSVVKSNSQVRDCILRAPNGLLSYTAGTSQDSIILKSGTILLCANGIDNVNKTGINKKVIITQDLTPTVDWVSADDGVIFYVENASADNPNPRVEYYAVSAYDRGVRPTGSTKMIWYDIINNIYQTTSDSGSTWTNVAAAEIGRFSTNSSGRIVDSSFRSYVPLRVATVDDIRNSSIEIDGVLEDVNSSLATKADVDLSNTSNTLPNVFIDKLMPDYDNGISLLHQSGNYRMPSAGIVCTSGYWTSGDPIGLAINNIVIAECSSTSVNKNFHAQVLVSQGDKVEVGLLPGGATSQANILFANFYPLKGANLGGV